MSAMKNIQRVLGAALLAAAAGLAGCGSPVASEEVFLQGGVPAEAFRVGGGFQIRFMAPETGAVYLVEQHSGTLLATESLARGQMYEFFPTQDVVDGFRRVGVDLAQGEFAIYFVPAKKLYPH